MAKAIFRTSVICLAAACALCFLIAAAQEPKQREKKLEAKPASIVGAWTTTERHIALGNLYQPEHGVRKRKGTVHFKQDGDRLVGHGESEDLPTGFHHISFADNRLVFEFDIKQWRENAGPIAVEERKQENKGKVRVEAQLQGERLVGKFGMFLADGTEVFRGEWEAVRAKESKQK